MNPDRPRRYPPPRKRTLADRARSIRQLDKSTARRVFLPPVRRGRR